MLKSCEAHFAGVHVLVCKFRERALLGLLRCCSVYMLVADLQFRNKLPGAEAGQIAVPVVTNADIGSRGIIFRLHFVWV